MMGKPIMRGFIELNIHIARMMATFAVSMLLFLTMVSPMFEYNDRINSYL